MRIAVCIMVVLFIAGLEHSFAGVTIEDRLDANNPAERAFLVRVKDALNLTEKRIKAVFGITPEARVVVESSNEGIDLKLTLPVRSSADAATGILVINSRVVQGYSAGDLKVSAARHLYLMVWPKFRKPYSADSTLIERLYREAMTAYAAELLYPGMSRWKYAGIYGSTGEGYYDQYLAEEKGLARELLRTLSTSEPKDLKDLEGRLFPVVQGEYHPRQYWGNLLSYRIIKTFERVMDPKMIQLMDFNEFRERLPTGLDALAKGSGKRR